MALIDIIFQNEEVKKEYKKALMLNMFKKLVVRMNKQEAFKQNIKKLFVQSTDRKTTVKVLIRNHFNFELDDEISSLMQKWFEAYFSKQNHRKPFSLEIKQKLIKKQNGKCIVCGEPLSEDLSKVHVDHIIPWVLVGDELKDNYQCLCDICNECKSAQIDYMFKNLIKLN